MAKVKPKKSAHGGQREGAGRKRVYQETAKISITLDAELLRKFDDAADAAEMNRSAAIQLAIRAWLGAKP